MADYYLQVSINLLALQGVAQRGLQRLVDQLDFARAGSALVSEATYPPSEFLAVHPSRNTQLSLSEARAATEQWLVLHVLRDAIEIVSTFLEHADRCCGMYRLASQGVGTGADLVKLDAAARRFHRLGLPLKLRHMLEQYGVDSEFSAHIVSHNDARNCVVHRHCIVGLEDSLTDGKLQVHWMHMRLEAVSPDGEHITVLEGPAVVEAGWSVQFVTEGTTKAFELGARLELTYGDLAGVLLSQLHFINTFAQSIQRYAEGLRVVFSAPPQPNLTLGRPD